MNTRLARIRPPAPAQRRLHIWINSSKSGNWTVHKSTHYDTRYLGKRPGKTIYVELTESGYIRCSGY
jgi:hypothetical protein